MNTITLGKDKLRARYRYAVYERNPALAEQWDYEKNEIKPTEVALHSSKYAWWRCPKGHSWKAKVSNRQKGNGCPYCTRKKAITDENDLATVMPGLTAEWDNEKNNGHTPDHFYRSLLK